MLNAEELRIIVPVGEIPKVDDFIPPPPDHWVQFLESQAAASQET